LLNHAEFVPPRVAEYPEVKPSLLLVVPPYCAECFQSRDFRIDVVGLDIDMHTLLGILGIAGPLKQDPDVRVRQDKAPVDMTACRLISSSAASSATVQNFTPLSKSATSTTN
jgi:hypothetical protein